MGVTARRKGLRSDHDDFKPAAELIQKRVVVALALVEGLKKTRRALKNLADGGKARRRKQSGHHAALRREADTQSLGQRWRRRAVARDCRTAKGDAERVMQSGFVQAENFAAGGRGREWPKRDSARVDRLGIGREPKADAQIGAETNRGNEVFAGHIANFFRRSQGGRDDRDARFIGDAVVVDIELTAVA